MSRLFAIIGGTGVYDQELLADVRSETVATPFGEVALIRGGYQGREVAFLPRHGSRHSVPPHRINYRANVWALAQIGVRRVLATTAVGSMHPDMAPGAFVFIDQFIDFTRARTQTFFDGGEAGVVHADFTEPYCPELRQALVAAAAAQGIAYHGAGTYVCTEGPRFETPAEVRALRRLGGDLVGMTNVPEVVLAREAGLCYATVSMVTNWAAGIAAAPLAHDEVLQVMKENGERLRTLLMAVLASLPGERGCRCPTAHPGLQV